MKATFHQWKEFLRHHPDAHLLQQAEWGELKSHFGWSVERIAAPSCGAQILFRKLPLGLTIAYIPKGPIGNPDPDFWQETAQICTEQHAIFMKIEPDAWQGDDLPSLPKSAVPSAPIQPRQTSLLDLNLGREALLAGMKQKTRYNIQLAGKKEVKVTASSDLESFHHLMMTTADRDGFGVHQKRYYELAYQLFNPIGACELFIASYQDQALAGILVFRSGKRAWYFYGASSNLERNRMPAYLLQWKAIEWALEHDCTSYDLWGIPDAPLDDLEAQFESRNEGLWGVYRFKRGFNGQVKRSAGAFDIVFQPLIYKLYSWFSSIRKDRSE